MARGVVPYSEGVPSVLPDVNSRGLERAFQHIPTTVDEFGGAIARGEQQLGQGATDASKFYSQVAAQQALNNWQDETDKILRGDPSVPGDVGYLGLKGQDAMDARGSVAQRLSDAEQNALATLPNAEAQFTFRNEARRLRSLTEDRISGHYDQQSQEWRLGVNETAADLALRSIGNAVQAGDDAALADAGHALRQARVRAAQDRWGTNLSPEVLNDTIARADSDAVEARIKTLLPTNPDQALRVLNDNRALLSTSRNYDALASHLQGAADKASGLSLGRGLYGSVTGAGPSSTGGGVAPGGAESATRVAGVLKNEFGWTNAAVAGALNNGMQESNWRSWNNPGSAGEMGFFQFNPASHLSAFRRQFGNDTSPEAQARYVGQVVGRAMPDYGKLTDAATATRQFHVGFEAPADQSQAESDRRFAYNPQSQAVLASLGGGNRQATGGGGFDLAAGDSIGVGHIRYAHLGGVAVNSVSQPEAATADAAGGRNPQQGLDFIGAHPERFQGKRVLWSSGLMNAADPQAALATVGQQLDALKAAGATPVLAGVDQGKFAPYNAQLAQIADQHGVPFAGPLPTNDVHPGPQGYASYAADAAKLLPGSAAGSPANAAPGAAFAANSPDIDDKIARVQEMWDAGQLSDGAARAAIGEINRLHRNWLTATKGERAAVKQSISGGVAILASGRDFDFDEGRIRQLFPAPEAEKYLALLEDARDQGDALKSVAGSTPEQLAATRARLQADLDSNLNPVDFARRQRYAGAFEQAAEHRLGEFETQAGQEAVARLRTAPVPPEAAQGRLSPEDLKEYAKGSPQHAALAAQLGNYPSDADAQRRQRVLDHFDGAVVQHYRALATDPASYVAAWNPGIQAKAAAAAQASDPEQARTTFAAYAADVLGMQDHLGLGAEQQHVLGVPQARAIATQLAGDPENAPARFRQMASRFGDYWPRVWQDLSTIGKLPGGWQLVGQLADYDPANAGLLARQLAQQPRDARDSALREKAGAGAKSIEAQLGEAVDGDPRVVQFDRSLANGFVGETARNEITGAIGALAKARYLYAGEDPATAAAKAVDAAIGHYEFDPRSGARAPADRFDAISANARATLDRLSPAGLTVPPGFGGGAQPTPEDYAAAVKSAGLWVNAPRNNSWWLVDQGGRFVLDRAGNHVAIPFSAAQLPPPTAVTPMMPVVASPF